MSNCNNFIIKLGNESFYTLKPIYNKFLIDEIKHLFVLFNNKKYLQIHFWDSYSEVRDYEIKPWVRSFVVKDCIYVLNYNKKVYYSVSEFQKIILHEIVHALIYRKVHYNCPLWVNEGLALVLSKQYKDIDYKEFCNNNYDLSSYETDYFYEKCCAKTINYINYYGKANLISRLVNCNLDDIKADKFF